MNIFKDNLAQKNSFLRSFTTLLCEGAENNLIFTKEKSSSLSVSIKKINNGLFKGKKNPKSFKSSIIQLISLLQQCPQSILNAEGERWVQLCINSLSNPNESLVKCLLFIIRFIIRASHDNKELSKKLSKLSLMLVERLSRCHISIREHSFKCLYEDLSLFPNQALSHKKFIEIKLMKVLSSPFNWNRDLVYAAASVYAALPLPGGVGNAPEMKGGQLEQLISLSHHAADAVFYDIKENEKYDFSRDHKLPIKTIDSVYELKDPVMRILTASLVLGNTFEFIKIFFEKCLSRYILIKPKDLINLSFRVLQVELQSLRGKESIEIKTLSFILPSLHSRALSLLKSLIQNNFCALPMNLVEEHLVLTLKSTRAAASNLRLVKGEESNQNSETMLQSFLTVRIQCYEALNECAKISNGIYGNSMEGLVSNLVADTTPVKDTITLKQAIIGGRLSLLNAKKKSKKKGYSVTSDQCQSGSGDVAVCQAVEQKIPLTLSALKLIETLFTYAHHSCPLKYVKVLQDHLMALIKTRRSGIYEDARVRECLFSAIIANVLYPHPLCPPPFNFIYQILQNEALHSRDQVSGICMKGLSALAFITSNPNTVNWSDIVSLNKDSKEVNTSTKIEEPLLTENGIDDESDMSDDENDEVPEDDEEDDDDEPPMLNLDDNEDEDDEPSELFLIEDDENYLRDLFNYNKDNTDNIKEGEENDVSMKVKEIEHSLSDEDGHLNNSDNFEKDLEDEDLSEEDSFGNFDMNINCNGVDEEDASEEEEEEEIDVIGIESELDGLIDNEEEEEVNVVDEASELDALIDNEEEEEINVIDEGSEVDKLIDNEEEEKIIEEEEEEEEANTSVGLKRTMEPDSDQVTKKTKVDTDYNYEADPSVAEMLSTFVDADPDSESDHG